MLALTACAPDPADALEEALGADVEAAIELCGQAGDDADTCLVALVRRDPAAGEACESVSDERWRGECNFSRAEHLAKAGDRWGALSACGLAGAYYDECLYHAWTFDLQNTVDGLGHAAAGLERARPIVEFWSSIQTIGPNPEAQIWRDWWYFAHARNKPASLGWCDSLAEADRVRCIDGTTTFVRRTVVETLIRSRTDASQRDRMCRGGADEAKKILGQLYRPDPGLDAVFEAALAEGCAEERPERPWNPVFRGRRG